MEIFQVDAFTTARFTGNPATVILGADGEPDSTLSAIAREFPHAETAFVLHADAADHDLRVRFFNARKEAPFVGHATIAAHAVLLFAGRRRPGSLRQKSGTGIIDVAAANAADDGGARVFHADFRQTAPSFDAVLPEAGASAVARSLGIEDDALDRAMPARIARKGSSRLLLAVSGEDVLDRIEPRFDALLSIGRELGAEGFFVFRAVRDGGEPRTYSRMFCPALGIPEDPVSGNAHAMLAAYLIERGFLTPADRGFTGHQGAQMRRPGRVRVTPEMEGVRMSAARIGGDAVIVSAGRLS